MKTITVTVEGAPKSGKTRLIEQLKKVLHENHLDWNIEWIFFEKITNRNAINQTSISETNSNCCQK